MISLPCAIDWRNGGGSPAIASRASIASDAAPQATAIIMSRTIAGPNSHLVLCRAIVHRTVVRHSEHLLHVAPDTMHTARADALHQSELDLIDGKGAVDEGGRTLFSYRHPIFRAPFSVIGD